MSRENKEKTAGLSAFWAELKRRKVVRVAVTYAVVGWLVIQVAVSTFPTLDIPDWALSLVVMCVILGFPISLILAWAFQLTAQGVKVEKAVGTGSSVPDTKGHKLNYIILGLVVVVLLFQIVDRYFIQAPRVSVATSSFLTQGDRPTVAGTIQLPDAATLAFGESVSGDDPRLIDLSPDSEWLVYVGRDEIGSILYRKHLNGFKNPEPIPGTEGAVYAFFSPDGRSIGFLTNDRIKRVSIDGTDLRTLSNRSVTLAHWTESDWVYYFRDVQGGFRMWRVPASGGEEEAVFDKSFFFFFSDILPGGKFGLASMRRQSISGDYGSILLIDLETGEIETLGIPGYDARWISTGHLVFGRSGNLMAVPFDRERGSILGEAVPLIQDVSVDSMFNKMQIAVSSIGTLAYVPGTDRGIGNIVAINREGVERHLPTLPAQRYGSLDLSENDGSLAVHVADVKDFVLVYDLDRQEGRKLAGSDGYGRPKWNPDGRTLAMSSNPAPELGSKVQILSIDHSTPKWVHTSTESGIAVSGWSPSGDRLAVFGGGKVGFMSSDGENSIQWADNLPVGSRWDDVFSPDGQWLAYLSDESGRNEIWIRTYPDGNVRRQVSSNGGQEPIWCESGEIFFQRGNQFWSRTVQLEPELILGPERLAFTLTGFTDTLGINYDVSSDGQTLYAVKRAQPAIDDRIHVVSNWFEELERLVPTDQ